MMYVGIDIAKLDNYASTIDSYGVVLFEPYKYRNDADGFHTLSFNWNNFWALKKSSSVLS